MRLVFAHDHIFKQDNEGNFYTSGSFNNQVWKRYLRYFDELIVVARLNTGIVNAVNNYNEFNLTNAYFKSVPSLSGPIAQFKNKPSAKKLIVEELIEADVLVARLPSEIGNLAIQIAKKMGKPYVVEVVACVWDALWNYGSLQAKVYAPIAMFKMKKRVKGAPYVIYVTNNFLQNRYPSNGITENISNVEIEQVDEKALEQRLDRYEKDKKLFTIGMIGSLKNKIKGLEIALMAFDILNRKNISFQFKILGDGNQEYWKTKAKELGIANKIEFYGVLPGGNPVLQWLDDIDIYIQPSYQEGLPRAVIEAMSRGCPVIGSTAGGLPELIDNRYIHQIGNYNELADFLEELLLNYEKASYLARQNITEAQKYTKNILDNKRDEFWSYFLDVNDLKN